MKEKRGQEVKYIKLDDLERMRKYFKDKNKETKLFQVISDNPGNAKVTIELTAEKSKKTLDNSFNIENDNQIKALLESIVGHGNVYIG